ncbi:gamma-carboxygeranoyl-CoA hydratase [Pseudomonas matsuisoli]|uniref:Gamma-carboxygeranoyl-CoA hydratase n=1 Tax=Pseudomonas matsuisoli TaxID=1515666 RepID=A0A917PNM1_9PSED|nr:gamma-carboxygeranoyl-CoA hydratase [Pseudomonas matsuisoli]GGJ85550.1 gamma-carboxygeranoyl-CoA hydratase [Pseudomonas matsuisoli]
MTTYTTLELAVTPAGIATLWLNRPDKNNAFNGEMINELIEALTVVAANEKVRLLLLRGHGKHFSAGADLAWMQVSANLDYAANLKDAHALGELMECLYHLPCPTLAVVQGAAFGGAVGLVACCDMAIGTPDAVFSLSEVRIGLVPAVISPYVVQAVGERAARRYALSGERFNGERARELGLLCEAYPTDALDAAVDEWAAMFLLNSPHAMRATKALLHGVGSGVLSEALRQRTESVIAGIRVSEEGQEGLKAFLEKRTPCWQEQ